MRLEDLDMSFFTKGHNLSSSNHQSPSGQSSVSVVTDDDSDYVPHVITNSRNSENAPNVNSHVPSASLANNPPQASLFRVRTSPERDDYSLNYILSSARETLSRSQNVSRAAAAASVVPQHSHSSSAGLLRQYCNQRNGFLLQPRLERFGATSTMGTNNQCVSVLNSKGQEIPITPPEPASSMDMGNSFGSLAQRISSSIPSLNRKHGNSSSSENSLHRVSRNSRKISSSDRESRSRNYNSLIGESIYSSLINSVRSRSTEAAERLNLGGNQTRELNWWRRKDDVNIPNPFETHAPPAPPPPPPPQADLHAGATSVPPVLGLNNGLWKRKDDVNIPNPFETHAPPPPPPPSQAELATAVPPVLSLNNSLLESASFDDELEIFILSLGDGGQSSTEPPPPSTVAPPPALPAAATDTGGSNNVVGDAKRKGKEKVTEEEADEYSFLSSDSEDDDFFTFPEAGDPFLGSKDRFGFDV